MIRKFRCLSYGSSVENLPPVGKTIAVIEVPVPGLCIGFIGGRTILVDVGIIALTMRPGVVPAEGHTFGHSALERKQHAVILLHASIVELRKVADVGPIARPLQT